MEGKVNILEIQAMKHKGDRIVMITAYDYPSAMIADCGPVVSRKIRNRIGGGKAVKNLDRPQ